MNRTSIVALLPPSKFTDFPKEEGKKIAFADASGKLVYRKVKEYPKLTIINIEFPEKN